MSAEELFEIEKLRALLIKGRMTIEKKHRFKQLLCKYYSELKKEVRHDYK